MELVAAAALFSISDFLPPSGKLEATQVEVQAPKTLDGGDFIQEWIFQVFAAGMFKVLLNVNSAKICEIHNLIKLSQIFLNLKFNFLRI